MYGPWANDSFGIFTTADYVGEIMFSVACFHNGFVVVSEERGINGSVNWSVLMIDDDMSIQ